MTLAELCVRRPVFATMLTVSLVVVGGISYRRLGVELLPNVEMPTVTVFTPLPGAGPEEVESAVTQPLEEVLNTIAGIQEMRSVNREGFSFILLTFTLDRPVDAAVQDVRDKVSQVMRRFPEGTDPPSIGTFDSDSTPIRAIAISGPQSLRELTEFAETRVKDLLATAPGVGAVTVEGGRRRALNVIVDAARLSGYGLTVADVERAIRAGNVEIPGGRVTRGAREDVLRTMARIGSVEEFRELVIAVSPTTGAPVKLREIAEIEDGTQEPRGVARLQGREAVTLSIQKQSGANLVQTAAALDERLKQLQSSLPAGAELLVLRDAAVFVKASTAEAQLHLVLGGILAALAVLLFMGSLRATIIAGVAIPSSLIATFTVMQAFGFSLNNITLLALTLAVGIVIDDAIVVIENIHRQMEERKVDAFTAAIDGTKEIALAVTATTLSLVVIFLPVAFLSGQVGRLFHSYGVTVSAAVLVSLFVAFTATPMLASRFLEPPSAIEARVKRGGIYAIPHRLTGFLDRHYVRLVAASLRHRWVVVLLGVACVASSVPLWMAVGKDFVPEDDQSEFEINVEMPTGTSFAASSAVLEELETQVRRLPGVTDVLASIGDTRGGSGVATRGSIYVALVPIDERAQTQAEVMQLARKIFARYPDLRPNIKGLNTTGIGGGGGYGGKLRMGVRGPDLAKLEEILGRALKAMRQSPKLVDVFSPAADRLPELQVRIDRPKAADLGLDPAQIAEELRTLVGGEIVSFYRDGDERYDVLLRARLQDRDSIAAIGRLPLRAKDGRLVPIENVATIAEAKGPTLILRLNGMRQVFVTGNPAPGIPLTEAKEELDRVVAELNLPPGYDVKFLGDVQVMEETGREFLFALLLSLVFMYMVLAAQFESFLHPVTILLALPLTLPFALLSLLATGETVNVYSLFGIFLLFGIVKKNGILQVDYTNTLLSRGMERDAAILEANRARLRPILMTTLTLIAGMAPMALGEGPGAASRASLAKVVVGGQALSLLITLLIVPVAYSLFDDLQRWYRRKRPARAVEAS